MPPQLEPLPVFAFWDGSDHSLLIQFKTEWQAQFPQFRIYGNDDVAPLIERHLPGYLDLYNAIRIPAARADVARLILLFELGGLYIDCHCGVRDVDGIRRLLAQLEQVELIFFDRMRDLPPGQTQKHTLINAMLVSRPRSDLILAICRQAFTNLAQHRESERKAGLAPYSIWALCGPGLISAMVLLPNSYSLDVRPEFQPRIMTIPEEDAPIARNRHRTYSRKGQHWSERQKVERLFEEGPRAPEVVAVCSSAR